MSIIYNGKDSLNDFGLYIASKDIPSPVRKTVTDSVPYMSGLWDFSQDEFEPIKIKYTFDVTADSKRELSNIKSRLLAWINNPSKDGMLFDTDISTTEHFKVYHAAAAWSSEDLQGLLTAEFTCYPFTIREESVMFEFTTEYKNFNIVATGRPITPIIKVEGGSIYIKTFNGSKEAVEYGLSTGTFTNVFTIPAGRTSNTRLRRASGETVKVTVTWTMEGYA